MMRRCLPPFTAMFATLGMLTAALGAGPATAPESHQLSAEEIERLLSPPRCLESPSAGGEPARVEAFPVPSNGITLSAQLHLPDGDGPWPAVILVPGGFNETELIMRAPQHDAPLLAGCGFAAVVFYKRGTGPSGGDWKLATFDDFIDDIGSIARQLARRPEIDPARIGVKGGSSGGFFASIAAARYPEIRFVVNASGPIVPREEESDFNIEHAIRSQGHPDSLVDKVMPIWRHHHAAWALGDTTALQKVAAEILAARSRVDAGLLPPLFTEVFSDSNLVFMWPVYRSASREYLSELKTLRKPWLSIYGEKDPIVPVASCARNIAALSAESGNPDCDVVVLPGVNHSFVYPGTRDQVPTLRIIVNWMRETIVSR